MNKTFLASAAICLISASAFGQTASYFVPDNNATTGGCNVIPFGTQKTSTTWVNQRYQTMVMASDLSNAVLLNICDIGFARCGSGDKVTEFDSIEIVMAQTKATTLGTTFSANLVSNVQTVLSAKNYKWINTGGTWDRIGLDKDYLYIAANGPNIVVQITTTGCNQIGTTGFHTGARQRLYRFTWTGTPPTTGTVGRTAALKMEMVVEGNDLGTFGAGCAGSTNLVPALNLTGSGQLGQSMAVGVSNCLANAVALHVFGLTRYPSPVDLGFAGAPGCNLYQSPDIILPFVANASGSYGTKVTVPKDRSLICLRIYTQGFPADARANNWGRTASNYGRILPNLQ